MARTFILLLSFCLPQLMAEDQILWLEGERPLSQSHIVANQGLNNINPYAMSGGAWLSSFTEIGMPELGSAQYSVSIPSAGSYHLWVRAVVGTGLSYQVDGGAVTSINPAAGVDSECTASDGSNAWPPTMFWYDQHPPPASTP